MNIFTDEDIKEIVGPWGDTPIKGYTRSLFDRIEAKLREKRAAPQPDASSDYERGFIEGMQKQMQSSVDKAVNRMAALAEPQPEIEQLKAERDALKAAAEKGTEYVLAHINQNLRAERDAAVKALTEISLCSQNSASSKEECGRIARAAIDAARGEK